MKPRNLSRARNAKCKRKRNLKMPKSVQKYIKLVTHFLHCLLMHFAFLTSTLIANSIASTLPASACVLYEFLCL